MIIRCCHYFLDIFEIHSQRVMLERVHPFDELNEKKFREHFRLSKRAVLHILSEVGLRLRYGKSHSQQTTADNTKHDLLAYRVLFVVNT